MEDITAAIKVVQAWIKSKPSKETLQKRATKIAVLRQQQIEQFEVNQAWRFVYGPNKPKKKKEVFLLKEITYRNIWMEHNYIYNQIVEQNPNERFHAPEKYILQWKPPDSEFRLMIPLNDPQVQANAVKRIQSLTKSQRKKLLFFVTPSFPELPLYAPNIHRAAFESFHDRASVLKKICEKYMNGVITANDLHGILEAGYETWKMSLYNILTAEEQAFHRYLMKPPPAVIKKSIERQYLEDDITLQVYNDLKFPIRKQKKDEEAASYPRPYTFGNCIICNTEGNALIKCLHCTNLVCIACIQSHFLSKETSEGSFLLLHRRYCVRFGAVAQVNITPIPEPVYLRELRATGIQAATEFIQKYEKDKVTLNDDESLSIFASNASSSVVLDHPEESDEESIEMEKKKRDIQGEIDHLVRALTNCTHKIQHSMAIFTDYQHILDNPRRSEHLRERTMRLKQERIEKLQPIREKISRIKVAMKPHISQYKVDPAISGSVAEVDLWVARLERYLMAATYADFEEAEKIAAELSVARSKSNLLMQFVTKK